MKWSKIIPARFIVGIRDFEYGPELKSFLKEFPVSGISLFNSPHDSADYIWSDREAALEKLYAFLSQSRTQIRFLAADQEGGRVQRLRPPFIRLPSAEKIGDKIRDRNRPDRVFELYQLAARQLSLAGIQLNFAPVCDIRSEHTTDIIKDRSFGQSASEIIPIVKMFCEAMSTEGVSCTLKHFPGHGPTRIDSHHAVALIEKDARDYEHEDRKIFEDCAPHAFGIMTAHVALADQPDRILSLDKDFIKGSRSRMPTHLSWMTDDLLSMKSVCERKPWLDCLDAEYDYLNLCDQLDNAATAIEESILYIESKNLNFEDEQKLEIKSRHSAENFQELPALARFSQWKQEILEIEERGLEILTEEGFV